MSEMVERVARAIWEIQRVDLDKCDMELADVGDHYDTRKMAIAAINEMRVPTDEMIVAMHDGAMGGYGEEMGDEQRQYVVDCWADMIVAAGADQ